MTESQATENQGKTLSIRKKSKNCAGATFVEALIALAIFAVFATGSFKVIIARRNIMDMSRDHYIAANLAKNRLELVRTFDFDQIPQLAETAIQIDNSGIPATEGKFLRETAVTALNTNLLQLTITVKIQNRRTLAFDSAEESLHTYVSKPL